MEMPPLAGFNAALGLQLDEAGAGRVVARLSVTADHLQPAGLVHGGVYAAIAETVASIGASVNARTRGLGVGAVGLDNHTTFLRATGAGTVIVAEGVPHHAGRRTQMWTVTMRDEERDRELAFSMVRLHVVSEGDHVLSVGAA